VASMPSPAPQPVPVQMPPAPDTDGPMFDPDNSSSPEPSDTPPNS